MADKKISQLTAASTPLAGTEVLPIVQGGSTVKVSVDNLTAGKAVSALSFTGTNLKTSPTTANLDISGATIVAAGTDSNIDITMTPKGSGSLSTTKLAATSATIQASVPSGVVDVLVKNNGADGTSNTRIMSSVSGASGGDPKIGLIVTGERDYFWYIDNSDSDKLKLDSNGSDLLSVDTSGNMTLINSNFVVGTAGKGIDFSANTHAAGMTSELLNWYEEGTWTPQVYYQNATDQGNATDVIQVGHYTRVGNVVVANCYLTWTITGTPANDNVGIKNLPFTIKNSANYYPVAGAILGGADTNPTYGGWMVQGQPNTKVAIIFTGVNGDNQGNEVGTAGTKSLFFTLSYLV